MENVIVEDCPCCDGKGLVLGEFIEDVQSCFTCLGSGYFSYKSNETTSPPKEAKIIGSNKN
jgi:hypothetical protein